MKRCKPSEDVCLEHCLPLLGERFCADGCSHTAAFVNRSVFVAGSDGALTRVRVMKQKQCTSCGAWLPLGPSDEHASEQVEIEIRAAYLAHGEENEHEFRDEEWLGYTGEDHVVYSRDEGPVPFDLDDRGWRAGNLAAVICEHEEGGS